MSQDMDPPRLSKGSGNPLEQRLAGLVDDARADVGTPEQLMRLEASLLPLIGPPVPGPGAPPAAPAAPAGGAASVGATAGMKAAAIAVAVVAAAGGGLWLNSTRTPAPAPVEQRAPVSVVAPVEPITPAPSVAPEAPAEPPAMAPAPSHPSPPSGNAGSSKDAPTLSEPELIGQAQSALAGNPARALSLCEKHRKQFPHGVLVQEREVLAIEALAKLGRHAQAVDRGERFLKAFPSSAHRSKIVGIIGPR